MAIEKAVLKALIDDKLKPFAKKIDEEAFYAEEYLYALGKAGFLNSSQKEEESYLLDELELVNETAKVCMTTAFCLWCHLAALTYIRKTKNIVLREKVLSALERGELLGATGLSNPMKYYAGMEKLHLQAEQVDGGYVINGVLPAVSNLGANHYFGSLANCNGKEVMVFVHADDENLQFKEAVDFLGVNGSATNSVRFTNVFIADESVVSHDATSFIEEIRPTFVLYQIPLGIGVMEAAIEGIEKVKGKQNGSNQFLPVQAADIAKKIITLKGALKSIASGEQKGLLDICQLRLNTVYETLGAVQANMLHNGSGGYTNGSSPSRKLREAYFFANLTPTVRQLEKMTQKLKCEIV